MLKLFPGGVGKFLVDGCEYDSMITELNCEDGLTSITISLYKERRVTEHNDYKLISRSEVWDALTAGKSVKACVLEPTSNFNVGIADMDKFSIGNVRHLIENDNVVFYEKVEVKED